MKQRYSYAPEVFGRLQTGDLRPMDEPISARERKLSEGLYRVGLNRNMEEKGPGRGNWHDTYGTNCSFGVPQLI